MNEGEPKHRGDIPKSSELDVTEQFLKTSPTEFRDFLDGLWQKNKGARVLIEISEEALSEVQRSFLNQLQRDLRVRLSRKDKQG